MKKINYNNTVYYILRGDDLKHSILCIQGDHSSFKGEMNDGVLQCPLSANNAAALRDRLPWLKPQPLGMATSFGFGDRLGLATPGHIAAIRETRILPIFAQQSVRENDRTGRTPQKVLDDAMWAVFELDWRKPWGADADHVKEISDLPPFIDAGYTFYTIDPNQFVDNLAYTDSLSTLQSKVKALPWDLLGISLEDLYQRYIDVPVQLHGLTLVFQEETILRAAVKYGRAIAHIKSISDYLLENVSQFDLEVSIDETDNSTSVKEHYFMAYELRRLGVPFISLAPRFIGSFEKGVDYIGDLAKFDRELVQHTAVMRSIGQYKLSIHTGSDKFSIYPSIAAQTKNLIHVKTAGTSYLEALRVVAITDQALFREILDFCRGRYETDKATYHVSGKMEKVAAASELGDNELIDLFDQFDARQVLHVTFGSVLDHYESRLKNVIMENLDLYEEFLYTHFKRHLYPFS